MKKTLVGHFSDTVALSFLSRPSFAWEYSMTGEFEWRHNYFSRMGTKDLFGDASMQRYPDMQSANAGNGLHNFIGFAGPNIYTVAGWKCW